MIRNYHYYFPVDQFHYYIYFSKASRVSNHLFFYLQMSVSSQKDLFSSAQPSENPCIVQASTELPAIAFTAESIDDKHDSTQALSKYVPPHLRRVRFDASGRSDASNSPIRVQSTKEHYAEKVEKILTFEDELPWLVYKRKSKVPLSKWLEDNRPSLKSRDKVAWICVNGPSDHETYNDVDGESIDWNKPKRQLLEQIDMLARKSRCLTGKWLIFESTENIDSVWFRIAKEVSEGSLGVSCKVSPNEGPQKAHLICVYTSNYQDKKEIMAVRDALRSRHGRKEVMTYKPDIYTLLGIYAGNSWNIKPTLYSV